MDFESTADNLKTVDESGLSQVSKLAKQQLQLENSISKLETQLKEAKINLREISQEKLPSAMAEHSIQDLKLDDGSTIQVKLFLFSMVFLTSLFEAKIILVSILRIYFVYFNN